MLQRIIYVSLARQPLPLDVKDILASSRAHNPRLGVTGALCFLDGVYLQCLEGEANVLEGLYRMIRKDKRHTAPKLILSEQIESRQFEDWSMALMTWSEETRDIFGQFCPGVGLNLYDIAPDKATELMGAFASSNNWETL